MPQRPPKKWFDECVRSVEKEADVTDPKAVCGWNWYYHMSKARKREILRGELFDPEQDIIKESFAFDPKIKTPSVLTKKQWRELPRWLKKAYPDLKPSNPIRLKPLPKFLKVPRREYSILYRIMLDAKAFLELLEEEGLRKIWSSYADKHYVSLKKYVGKIK